ncbi:major facilitator superfamily transporter [Nitzschia inconspicua]|uniref:Major facilitator superfamily transporter n=1 Tax=Nitzschia inconspicua TaxID=303405 RepID=A0A9K3KA36_9STRA|nr:major facilitator superfamily transporter [Nitzschia inconspicua]
MKFAEKIVVLQHREWSPFYLEYNGLKQILAETDLTDGQSSDITKDNNITSSTSTIVSLLSKRSFQNGAITSAKFLAKLYDEVQKIALFVLKEEGTIADGLAECRTQLRQLMEKCQDAACETNLIEGGGEEDHDHPYPSQETTNLESEFRQLRDKYNHIAAELLQLIQFVDINVKGILRILKKHDKRVQNHQQHDLQELFVFGHNRSRTKTCPYPSSILMASLQNHRALDALCVTLQEGYTEVRLLEQAMFSTTTPTPPSTIPTTSSALAMDAARNRAGGATPRPLPSSKRRGRSPKGLGRRHRSSQGLANLAIQSSETVDDHDMFVDEGPPPMIRPMEEDDNGFYPMHHSPSFALVTTTNNKNTTTKFSSSSKAVSLPREDFVMAQIYAARRSITNHKSDVLNMLATTALGFEPDPSDNDSQQIRAEYEHAAALDDYKRKSAISSTLNLVSSFIYMTNYLIVIPTVVSYSERLGADPALSSAIVGMTPFATIFSTILYSWWTSYSYRIPLLAATILNVLGNMMYALGYPCNSMTFVLIGRLMSGMGSCRPINRRYIADAYSTAERTAASAHFVAVGCFGMALGPFLGSILHRIAEHSTSPYWQVENAPGWFMAAVWFVYGVFHLLYFVDPPREDSDTMAATSSTGTAKKLESSSGETKPLLSSTSELEIEMDDETHIPIWRNAPVMVNFFIYFIEKLLMECVSSSTSILTFYYFEWPGSWAGYWLAFLCILVLPVNLLVGYLSRIYEDREMMVVMQLATIVGCVVIMRFGEEYYIEQYLIGTLIIVVTSNMVEGPNMSLLSKTIPKKWRKGFMNVGLLATEAATMGRTAGDAFLALCGTAGIEHQLNLTFGSMIVATVFTLWITYRYYDSLIPNEDKNL